MAESRLARAVITARQAYKRHPLAAGVTAGGLFLAVFIPAIGRYHRLHLHPDPALLVTVAIFAPPIFVSLNAAEFALIARMTSHRVTTREAVTVSVSGTIANLLPIPGSVVIRSAALVAAGQTMGSTLRSVVKVGGVWIGVTAVAFGSATAVGDPAVGAVIAAGGLCLMVACLVRIRHQVDDPGLARRLMATVVAIEAAAVAFDAVRLLLILHAIGIHAGVLDALALTSANVLSTAVGILPAGLGLREALSAGLGAASGLPAAAAVTATVVDRVLTLVGLGAFSVGLLAWTKTVARRAPRSIPPTA
jgi:hypothetical protein